MEPKSDDTLRTSLDEVLAEYLAAIDAGKPVDLDEFIGRHPEFGPELRDYLMQFDAMAGCLGNQGSVHQATPTPTYVNDRIGQQPAMPLPRQFGDYEILGTIARGGMGIVHRARQIKLGRVVALKMMLENSATSEERRRFRLEVESVARLDHPNIVPIFEVGEVGQQCFFSMKLIEGGSLADALGNWPMGQRGWKLGARLLAQVARALHHAHERGIIHRDMKPGNVLLQHAGKLDDAVPYVTDFGLAKRVDIDSSLTQSGAIVGTPSYMAPEQATGAANINRAADVYALGAVLYQVITGRRPFQAETPMATLLMVQTRDPDRPTSVNAAIPPDLETVCLKALDKDPLRRYHTAEEFAEDLDRFVAGEPIRARAASRFERGLRWARKRPSLTMLASVLLVVAIATPFIVYRLVDAGAARQRLDREKEEREAELKRQQRLTDYVAKLGQLSQELRMYRRDKAREILATCAEDMRGWEWHYAVRLCQPAFLLPLESETRAVLSVQDQGTFASGGDDGVVRIWDPIAMAVKHELKGHTGPILDMQWNENCVVTGSSDHTIKVWDQNTWKVLRTLKGHEASVRSLVPLPTLQRLASASNDGTLRIWDWTTGKDLHTIRGHERGLTLVASAAAHQFCSGGADSKLKFWDAKNGQSVAQVDHPGAVRMLAYNPDLTHVLTWSEGREMHIWDWSTHKKVRTVKLPSAPTSISFLSSLTVTTHDDPRDPVSSWNTLQDYKRIDSTPISGFVGTVHRVLLSDQQDWLVTGGKHLVLWPMGNFPAPMNVKAHDKPITCLTLAASGGRLLSANEEGHVKVWDANTLRELASRRVHDRTVRALATASDGSFGVSASDGKIAVWNPDTLDELRSLDHGDTVVGLSISADAKTLVSASANGLVRSWDTKTWACKKEISLDQPIVAWACSPDGAAAWATPQKVIVANAALSSRDEFDAPGVTELIWSNDGKWLAACGESNAVRVWSARDKTERHRLEQATRLNRIGFSPDGQRLFVAGRRSEGGFDFSELRVWDVPSGMALMSFETIQTIPLNVRVLCIHNDGRRLIIAAPESFHVLDATPRPSGIDK